MPDDHRSHTVDANPNEMVPLIANTDKQPGPPLQSSLVWTMYPAVRLSFPRRLPKEASSVSEKSNFPKSR